MSEPGELEDEPCYLLGNAALHDRNKCTNAEHLGAEFKTFTLMPSMLRPPENVTGFIGRPLDPANKPRSMSEERHCGDFCARCLGADCNCRCHWSGGANER